VNAWVELVSGLSATAEIECGSASRIEAIDAADGRVAVEPGEDAVPRELQLKGPISCYNVCVALRNEAGDPRQLTVAVLIPGWLTEANYDGFLRKEYVTAPLQQGDGPLSRPASEWTMVSADRQRNREDAVEIDLALDAGEQVVLSSIEHYPVTVCNEHLRELASTPQARLRTIGQSAQGRPILALEVGAPDAPRSAVFTGTLQPGEPSAWAVLSMIEAALEGGWWLDEYLISFIPQTNPDGIYLGRCNVNARDELAALGFDEAAAGGRLCPQEVRVLWDYLSVRNPVVYLDFHFMRQTNHPYTKPYFIDPAIYRDPAVAEAAVTLNERYMEVSGAPEPFRVAIGDELWRGLAAYQVAAQLDAVSFTYQYTGPTSSLEGAQEVGPKTMLAALEVCRKLG